MIIIMIIVIIIIITIIIIIIIITITITITITIVSLKIWEVFLQFCILLPYRHLYKKEEYWNECSSHHVSHSSCGEDPGQSYPEETKDKHRGSSTRKPLCMVLGLAASQPTRFSEITGEGNRAKSTLLNTPLTLLFFILHLINNNFLED